MRALRTGPMTEVLWVSNTKCFWVLLVQLRIALAQYPGGAGATTARTLVWNFLSYVPPATVTSAAPRAAAGVALAAAAGGAAVSRAACPRVPALRRRSARARPWRCAACAPCRGCVVRRRA
jgi:hypothetical protein